MAASKLTALLFLTIFLPLSAQSLFQQKTVVLNIDQNRYIIADKPLIHHSESVYADSLLLISGVDYKMNYSTAELLLLTIPAAPVLYVEFIQVPPSLNVTLQRWESKARSDSLFTSLKRRANPAFAGDTKLEIQGVKTFAITFSDDEAFDLKQSLFVNLSGELAQGVSISAQLSDSQSRLSPEGDSKELSSLDKVFIKVYGNKYELAMGDIELKLSGSRYMEYQSKFEGINAWYKDKHAVQAAYSAGNGKSTSLNPAIVDGKQGPYYLRANDFQPGFIVVAGSEEVFVDGSRWDRGIDYTIDYAEGSLMFKRLISSTNQVLVRFQYTDEYFAISSFINSSTIKLGNHLSLSHQFIWQQDDKKHPLLFDFTASDLDSLSNAGDNLVWGDGITQVEPGEGYYRKIISQSGIEYYEYAYPDISAEYNIIFSYVGFSSGDYQEYSPGKFRYMGNGLGSWLPKKRLLAPVKQGNLDLALSYGNGQLNAGIEAIGTLNDRNSISPKDDDDNQSGIIYAYAELPISLVKLRIDREQRAAKSFLFGKYRNPELEFDLSGLESADSLAQSETNLSISSGTQGSNSTLMFRYKDIDDFYEQKALRFLSTSPALGIIPAINIRSTISQQDYRAADKPNGQLQYHQADASWAYRRLKLKLNGLYNLLDNGTYGSSYQKLSPTISLGNTSSIFTQVSYSDDVSKLKSPNWIEVGNSQTYAVKHLLSTAEHHIDVDATHRELNQAASTSSPKSNYDLVNFRSSHNFMKKAISLFVNYQLNQTEFYPKIRELQYIGNGLGVYDSTGVSVSSGDFDYVYITSANGSLSSEINTQLNLYLKPATLSSKEFFKRWHSDTSLNLNEQSVNHANWKSYLFLPGEVYSEAHTIYGKQTFQQTLWLNVISNRITGNLQLNVDRSLDKRYQSLERSYSLSRGAQMDIKGYNPYNTRLQYNHESTSDSRYLSKVSVQNMSASIQRNLATQSSIQTEFAYSSENGAKQNGSEDYTLSSYMLSPTLRSVWMQKYRISASFSLRRNFLSGSSYFGFLPQKREGWITGFNTSGIYRINSFSSVSMEYRFNDYPDEKSKHELKLEFKAEL
ncbi:MAG: hypothetical protein CVU50_00655 [Candidatus Cloacimonetes bacterium HGW-Cloacimonetes-3]|nr:MAG: hypothetical protein CVU50_00655 [Candidatus Cloacimonetes bacterium HGW-Cloacimonetes-3]